MINKEEYLNELRKRLEDENTYNKECVYQNNKPSTVDKILCDMAEITGEDLDTLCKKYGIDVRNFLI